MNYARWGWACLACAALAGGACESESPDEPQGAAGDDGAEAGAAGNTTGAGGNTAGAGGDGVDANGGFGGDATVACVEHPTCATWGANFYCPDSLADVQLLCDLGGVDVESSASDCGGTHVRATNRVQTASYSFDANGKLIGVSSIGDVGDCDHWGTRCEPQGASEVVCAAGGGGGAGGSDARGEGGTR